MSTTYAPRFLWILMGPLIGALSGAVVGTLVVWGVVLTDPSSWSGVGAGLAAGLFLGGIYGGVCGIPVGLVAGIPLVFLVGRHLPRGVARRRAHVLGALLPPVAMLGLAGLLLDVRLSWPHADDLGALLVLAGAALLGSRLAGWVAGRESPRPRVEAS